MLTQDVFVTWINFSNWIFKAVVFHIYFFLVLLELGWLGQSEAEALMLEFKASL